MSAHGRTSEYLDGVLDVHEEVAFLDHLVKCRECQAELHDEVQLRDREDALRAAAGTRCALDCRVHEYLDGALDANEEAAFLDHLAGCAKCQAELHDEVQLRDREDALREQATTVKRREAAPVSARSHRVRRIMAWAMGPALAALLVFLLWPRGPITLTSRPTRAHEIRFSYPGAAGYRPYDTLLGSATPSEPVGPDVIAKLDHANDCQGVATAYVLAGELVHAEERYRRCAPSIDLDADRAGLAVLGHDYTTALDLTEAVLDVAPRHTVALWNRALALHGLGLELSAAAAFDRVATFDAQLNPGWALEAAERARNLRSEIERIRRTYKSVDRLGQEMVHGGPPIASDLAQQVPGRSRVHLHDAIRAATTAARLDELAPLAAALEGRAGNDLGRYLDRARAQLSPERAAASAGYVATILSGRVDDAAWTSWLALANRAHADDLILGARIVTQRLDGDPSADQLAAATRDPWFEFGVALPRARAALDADRIQEATARLTALQDRCPAGSMTFRCLQLTVELARLANDRDRPAEAKRDALAAFAMSQQLGEWPQRAQALVFAGDAERFGGAFAAAGAYYEESSHSLDADACGAHIKAFTTAEMLFQRHRLALAQAEAAAAPACDQIPDPNELTVLVRLLRAGRAVLDRAAVAAKIAQAQRAAMYAGDAPYLDYLAEWLVLDDDPTARERLARIADRARKLEAAMRDKTVAAIDNALFADAGRRRAWSEALAVAASAHSVATPERCALAFGGDDLRFTAVLIGPDGGIVGRYEPILARTAEWSAPAAMRQVLAGCADVVVLALPPWLGIGPLLDPQTPWHYVLGPPPPQPTGRTRRVVVSAPVAPREAGKLAPLAPRTWVPAPDQLLTGSAATPESVLAAISDATLIEIHSHATWSDAFDAPVLALSPGANGWALDAAQIRAGKLTGAPVVMLVDCAGGAPARFEHQAWGLPLAFRAAGASAVIASLSEIPDREAVVFFDAVTAELARGISPASAVARARAEKMRADPTSWVRDVVVFQ
jgi:hypothetical protein